MKNLIDSFYEFTERITAPKLDRYGNAITWADYQSLPNEDDSRPAWMQERDKVLNEQIPMVRIHKDV